MAHRIAKICLIGDAKVGKTSLRKRYMGQGFTKSHLMTMGADFAVKTVDFTDGTIVSLQIWDLAGQESFQKIRLNFYRNTEGIIFVYDVTNKKSLENMVNWLSEMWQVTKNEDMPIVAVGNKIDLEDQRVLSEKSINQYLMLFQEKYKRKPNIVHQCETSAKTGEGVDDVFRRLATYLK